ncbi:MAG: tryptophan--tRNA ligase [bacterium]|nr:tryptophan--tRNA ligase [bacterium]
MKRAILMTGDRPTGQMHLGHYVGSLKNRFAMQKDYRCFFMIADYQALTTHSDRSSDLEGYIREMVLDYLAAGFDPERSVCFLQSQVPQLAELTAIFGNLVTLPRLMRNPTIKQEIEEMGVNKRPTFGFVGYPVSQAADIVLFRPECVPMGEDQRPHMELAQEVAARFNGIYGEVFPIPEGVYGERMVGTDGRRKMSKSYGNAISLTDAPEVVEAKVGGMVTDPGRVRRSVPGRPELCSVFAYYRAFAAEQEDAVAADCRAAAVGCTDCKAGLAGVLNTFLEPFQERRAEFEKQPGLVRDILNLGGSTARIEGQRTLEQVKEVMGLRYESLLG